MKHSARIVRLILAALLLTVTLSGSVVRSALDEHLRTSPSNLQTAQQSNGKNTQSSASIIAAPAQGSTGAVARSTAVASGTATPHSPLASGSATPVHVPTAVKPSANKSPSVSNSQNLYVHLPPNAEAHQPLRVLVALHGVGNRGDIFAQNLVAESDRNGWVLVAPTFQYGNWMDPAALLADDLKYTAQLCADLDALPAQLGLKLNPRVMLFGFSRGAQLGHRFAFFYPDHVAAVAAFSGGSYTLPQEKTNGTPSQALPLPYGLADMAKRVGHPVDWTLLKAIPFFIAVGAKDNAPVDVPRTFDTYIGTTRVERGQAFSKALRSLGIETQFEVFPNTGHEVTTEMRNAALVFLSTHLSVTP